MAPEEPCLEISINHVSLSVVDMEESLRFYTEFLGMERIPGPQFGFRVEWLRVGDLEVHLFERETDAPQYHHVGFTVSNFEELYVRAKEPASSSTCRRSPRSPSCPTAAPRCTCAIPAAT